MTGTSAGLGHAIAIALARKGHDLALTDLDTAMLKNTGASQRRQASLTRYCGGIEQGFAPIGAGNPAVLAQTNVIAVGRGASTSMQASP